VRELLGGAGPMPQHQCDARKTTTRCSVRSHVVSSRNHKTSSLATFVDTPGHPHFAAEAKAGMALADTALVCVDCVEGLLPPCEKLIHAAITERLGIVLLLTKLDRLIVDLCIPPRHAHDKLRGIIDGVNNAILAAGGAPVSVVAGTVIFSSVRFGACFSVPQIAQQYADEHKVSAAGLAKRLWGPVTFDADARKFVAQKAPGQTASFVSFVMEPLYKVFSQTLASGTEFADAAQHASLADACRAAVEGAFGGFTEQLSDALLSACPAFADGAAGRVRGLFAAAPPGLLVVAPLIVDCGSDELVVVGKVVAGTLAAHASVNLVNRPESVHAATVGSIAVLTNDGLVPVQTAGAGSVVYIRGITEYVEELAVLLHPDDAIPAFGLLQYAAATAPCTRVAVEPARPEDMDKFKEGLRRIGAVYSGCTFTVEDTGEHVVQGAGELLLDTAMYDLRRTYCKGVVIKVSDPFVSFAETTSAPRGVLRTCTAPESTLSMFAAPLGAPLGRAMDGGGISFGMPRQQLDHLLATKYHWDILEVEGLTAFVPDPEFGANAVIADSVAGDALHGDVVNSVVQGIRMATRRGPLCGEPIREVKFSLTEATAGLVRNRLPRQSSAVVSNLSRQLTRSSFLSAAPRLMEPVVAIDIVAPPARQEEIASVIARRRGNIVAAARLAPPPLCRLQGYVPLIDSFGLETELRLKTQGDAQLTTHFDHWAAVPGDPLDDSVALTPLQAASGFQLARDFVNKTRRRKGMSDIIELI
jgi:U5 small nuclear ribonucleoprotein component